MQCNAILTQLHFTTFGQFMILIFIHVLQSLIYIHCNFFCFCCQSTDELIWYFQRNSTTYIELRLCGASKRHSRIYLYNISCHYVDHHSCVVVVQYIPVDVPVVQWSGDRELCYLPILNCLPFETSPTPATHYRHYVLLKNLP